MWTIAPCLCMCQKKILGVVPAWMKIEDEPPKRQSNNHLDQLFIFSRGNVFNLHFIIALFPFRFPLRKGWPWGPYKLLFWRHVQFWGARTRPFCREQFFWQLSDKIFRPITWLWNKMEYDFLQQVVGRWTLSVCRDPCDQVFGTQGTQFGRDPVMLY